MVSGGVALDTFSPREVQARVRAGASVDDVVAQTGWPQDKVLRYAEPVLGEREYIAGQARVAEVRRQGEPVTLEQSAAQALGLSAGDGSITWDSRRREDGKWIVVARIAGQSPEWIYEATGRTVHPLDDTARAWMGVHRVTDPIEDALGIVAETPVVRADADVEMIHEATTEPERPHLVALPSLADDSEDLVEADDYADDEDVHSPDTDTVIIGRGTGDAQAPSLFDETSASAPTPEVKSPRKAKSRKGRASVPSWDEILFGATKTDD